MHPEVRGNRGFTLVELLVVVGIIGLLIGILMPSLRGARNAAKKASTLARMNACEAGLQAFHNDLSAYPDSSKRPDPTDRSVFPTPPGFVGTLFDTTLYGAQALARALAGKDLKGYVDPRKARRFDPNGAPTLYYEHPQAEGYESPYPREDIYMIDDQAFVRTASATGEAQLGGFRPANVLPAANTQWVIVDAWDRPILYYRAFPRGNVLCSNAVDGGSGATAFAEYDPQNVPFYNQLDNDVFTGTDVATGQNSPATSDEPGWRFATEDHQLKQMGNIEEPDDLTGLPSGVTTPFARYIHNHKVEAAAGGKHVPVNPDSYLLISAGPDGLFGTNDDLNNFKE